MSLNPEGLEYKDYLGDGLYVGVAGHQIVLYSFNGVDVLDAVYLDPEVLRNFEHWMMRVRKEAEDAGK